MDHAGSAAREIATGARLQPAPAWAELEPYAIPETPNPHFVANGLCTLLDDCQVDLCGEEPTWLHRRAELITAPVGAEQAAQFSVSFDPAYEQIAIHAIAVIRGGRRIEHAETALFEVLRRERNMERMLFDGRLTVHATLPDVRPGDVVETLHSRTGSRKSVRGRFTALFSFDFTPGIVDLRVRLRAPASRALTLRTINDPPLLSESEADGIIERRWRALERPSKRYEPLPPPWTMEGAFVQISTWRDWAEAAGAFTPLYEDQGPLPEDIAQEVARIEASEQTQAGRAAAILRFVQGQVRYLAIAMGEGGYTPRSLADIWATRYGDCKDKSKLYAHMARALGVDACPALVNLRDGYAMADWPASGQLFDHCIVRVAADGAVYWLDPTLQTQPSPLAAMSQCHFGWALPLRPETAALERMADPPVRHLSETIEEVTLGDNPYTPVRYEWRITLRDVRAEMMRDQIARNGEVGLFKSYAEDIQRAWPGAKPVRQEIIEDDPIANQVRLCEVYEIANAWQHVDGLTYKFVTCDVMLARILAKLDAGERKHPVYLGQPGVHTRRVDIRASFELSAAPWTHKHEGSTLLYTDTSHQDEPRHLGAEQRLEIRALTLPAAEAETYRKIHASLANGELAITEAVSDGKFVGARKPGENKHPIRFWLLVALIGFGAAALIEWLTR